jgi:hypothetical protein
MARGRESDADDAGSMTAAYVFDAVFSVSAADVSLTPDRFETTLRL